MWYRSPGMDRDQMMALVNRSPEMVARHDREGWLDLFSSNGEVEDPVGGGPNRKGRDLRRGNDGLGRFYDIFIGPNRIELDVHRDIAAGDELVRDVSIHTTFGSGAVLVVHCYVLVRIVEENGRLRMESLRAHWDFVRSCVDLVRNNGFKGLAASMVQFGAMIRVQGLRRVLEYLGIAYRGIRREGVRKAEALAAALNARDEAALARLVVPGATVDFPAGGATQRWADFLAGPAAGMRLELEKLRSGGWVTSGAFRASGTGPDGRVAGSGGPDRRGVVFFEFSPRSRQIVGARFFCE